MVPSVPTWASVSVTRPELLRFVQEGKTIWQRMSCCVSGGRQLQTVLSRSPSSSAHNLCYNYRCIHHVGATQGNIIGEVSSFQGVLIIRGVLLSGLLR